MLIVLTQAYSCGRIPQGLQRNSIKYSRIFCFIANQRIKSKSLCNLVLMKRIHAILILGLINGLIFTFIAPPWRHYDEPGHFEYVWLIANRLRLPQANDYDQNMRLAVGKSLINSSFFSPGNQPNLTDPTQPIWIGVSQLTDPPLYYLIEAIPFFVLRGSSIDLQLYAGRITSLLFLLLTIFCAYLLTGELTPTKHPLRWMVPLFVAMLPGFVEFMTSINDYVAAIGFFSLWLVIAIRLIKSFSLMNVVILIFFTISCIFTQKILYPVILYCPIILLLSILPKNRKYLGWLFILAVTAAGLLIVFNWGDSAYWLRGNYQDLPTRAQVHQNNSIDYALQGEVYPDTYWGQNDPNWNSGFFQLVPINISSNLKGKIVTVGAWVWADKTIQGYGPGLNSLFQFQDQWSGFKPVEIDETPKFVASVIHLPKDQDQLQVWLRATAVQDDQADIFFSGIVMADGKYPVDDPPQFADKDGTKGVWGSQPFNNLIRNAQFRQSWPYVRPGIFRLITSRFPSLDPTHVSSFFSIFLDIPGTKWYTTSAGAVIFRTIWAHFGWGEVPLIAGRLFPHPYRILLIITLVGIAGSLITGVRWFKTRKNEFLFLFIVMGATIIGALFYGLYTMGGALRFRAFIPTARYVLPAILPFSFVLVRGWQGLFTGLNKVIKLKPVWGTLFYTGFLTILDFYSIISVLVYYKK